MTSSILIVGAGIAGPVLASFLLASPLEPKPHITLLERASTLRSQGQNVDVRGAGVEVLRKLGILDQVKAHLTQEIGAQWVDARNRVWGAFAADKSGRIQTGTSDIEILRGRLAEICFNKCKAVSDEAIKVGYPGVRFIFGDYLESLEQDAETVHVRLAKSKEALSFDIVVAADGLLSKTRRLALGPTDDNAALHKLGMYQGFWSMPKGGQDTLWRRWFRAPGGRGVMIRPGEDEDRSTAFMYVLNETDKRFETATEDGRNAVDAQKALLAEYFADAGWECPRLIQEMQKADDFYFSPLAQVKLPSWSRGRVVLLGDAAYCASPISGMGTTIAFTGAYNLAGALVKHPNDHQAAFSAFEEKMRPIVAKAQKLPLNGKAFPITHPDTQWGLYVLYFTIAAIYYSGIGTLLFLLIGPKAAGSISLDDYGFRQL